jgi:hypothetical protein
MSSTQNNNQTEKCENDILATQNYEVVRNENLKKTEQLYTNLLKQYTGSYTEYLTAKTNAANSPNNPELQNNNDKADVQTKPEVKKFNQKLIDVESVVLDNNKTMRQGIEEQKNQIDIDSKEKDIIDEKISKLEQLVNSLSDTNDTGKYGIKDLETQFNDATWWYYVLILVNFVLFIVFGVLFYKNLSVFNSIKSGNNI